MTADHIIRSGPDRGARCSVIGPQVLIKGRVNLGSDPIGVKLEDGRALSVPKDWIAKLNSRMGRAVARNVAKARAA
jgi:hypothetical protein